MEGGTIRAAVRYLLVFATFMVLSGWAANLPALEGDVEGESLSGLQGIAVLVTPTSSDAQLNGVKREQILEDIKQKLRKGGIKVLTDREMERPGFPHLDVNVDVTKDKNPGLYKYDIKVEQYIQSVINPDDAAENIGFAMFETIKIWSLGRNGTASKGDLKDNIQKQVNDIMEKFIASYQAANPKEGDKP